MKTKSSYFVTGEELKEKRTQFLLARCAESQYFGMSNVGDWLLKQKHLDRPTDIEVWTRIIQRNANMVGSGVGKMSLPELLCSHGLCLDEVNFSKEEHPSIDDLQGIHHLVDNVIGEVNEAYITHSGVVYLSADNKQVMRFEGNERGGTYTTSILISDVLESALLSWRFSNKQYFSMTARYFLYAWLERRIRYVIDEAGKEFDEAVAVTEDGSKIVSADRVVFSRREGPSLLYEKGLFAKKKILQQSNLFRDSDPVDIDTALTRENILAAFKGRFSSFMGPVSMLVHEHWQKFFTVVLKPDKKLEKWLWYHIGDDEYPEGGSPFSL